MWGVPFSAGFFSKEPLLLALVVSPIRYLTSVIVLLRLRITTIYCIRITSSLLTTLTAPYLGGRSFVSMFRALTWGGVLAIFFGGFPLNTQSRGPLEVNHPVLLIAIWRLLFGARYHYSHIIASGARYTEFLGVNTLISKEVVIPNMALGKAMPEDWDFSWVELIGPKGIQITLSERVKQFYMALMGSSTPGWVTTTLTRLIIILLV